MYIKTKRYHYTSIRKAKIQNTDNNKCWQKYETMGTLIHCWWGCKMIQPLWKAIWWFLTKLNILLSYNPAIMFLSIYPNELKTYVHTKTCTQMFTAALFITAKSWKQPRYSSIGEWINCSTSRQQNIIHTKKQKQKLKKKQKLWSHKNMWRKLKCILLSERGQHEKATCCVIPTIWHSGKGRTMEIVKRLVIARGWR